MAGFRVIDLSNSMNGINPDDIVTKDELFDPETGKIDQRYIDASISAQVDLSKPSTTANTTPAGVSWKSSEQTTVQGSLVADKTTMSKIYLVKDYDSSIYTSYITMETGGVYRWVELSSDSGLKFNYVAPPPAQTND